MTSRKALPMFVFVLAMAGCLSDEPKLQTVGSTPIGRSGRTRTATFQHAKPATEQVAIRVKTIGQKIVAANPRINQKVDFFTVGAPQEEIFHQTQKDVSTVIITEGLAKQCKTDGELAALLSVELGELVSEQMVQAQPLRSRRTPPPVLMNPHVGNDNNGAFGSSDGTDQMIAAHLEKEWQQSRQQGLPAPPPAPEKLARAYLQSAGFNPKDLDAVKALLKKADGHSSLEQSMTGKQR